MRKCENCGLFNPSEKLQKGNGECRRYPPIPAISGERVVSMWPLVQQVDWCDEFKQAEKKVDPKLELI